MDAPNTLITVPNGNETIDKKCKYIVLQDFWLKDICLKQGQIITDPVSKRWIDLRLIKPYCACKKSKEEKIEIVNTATVNPIESDLNSDVVSITDAVNDTVETEQPKKRRGRPSKII